MGASKRSRLHLAEGWALGWDKLQWMLLRARESHAETRWIPVSYVATRKAVLLRGMRENGLHADPEGLETLSTLPDHFSRW